MKDFLEDSFGKKVNRNIVMYFLLLFNVGLLIIILTECSLEIFYYVFLWFIFTTLPVISILHYLEEIAEIKKKDYYSILILLKEKILNDYYLIKNSDCKNNSLISNKRLNEINDFIKNINTLKLKDM